MDNSCHPGSGAGTPNLLHEATQYLALAGVPDPGWDAQELLEWAGGPDRSHLLLWDGSLSADAGQRFEEGLRQRAARIPLQQITGRTWFMGLPFQVTDQVLCPRPDTEVLVERGISLLKENHRPRILDLCCGSGCIGISLAHYLPRGELVLSDISPEALKLAKANAEMNGLRERILFAWGDMMEARLEDGDKAISELDYDLICCNPPYIPGEEIDALMPEVKDHEPRLALDGGKDGLDFYRRLAESIIKTSSHQLGAPPRLLLEIGCEQAEAVSEIFREAGAGEVRIYQDLAGLDRVAEIVP